MHSASKACPPLRAQSVLGAPLGVVRLVGVLGDQDALRNEALLLLQQLVPGSAELQKMAVFEGAFDRIWAILGWAPHAAGAAHFAPRGGGDKVLPGACPAQPPSPSTPARLRPAGSAAAGAAAAGRRGCWRAASWCRTACSCWRPCFVATPPTS